MCRGSNFMSTYPSRGLLRDYEPSDGPSFQALAATLTASFRGPPQPSTRQTTITLQLCYGCVAVSVCYLHCHQQPRSPSCTSASLHSFYAAPGRACPESAYSKVSPLSPLEFSNRDIDRIDIDNIGRMRQLVQRSLLTGGLKDLHIMG